MSNNAATQDAQWLKSLPETLGFDFERFFWGQPEQATAWFGFEEDAAFVAGACCAAMQDGL